MLRTMIRVNGRIMAEGQRRKSEISELTRNSGRITACVKTAPNNGRITVLRRQRRLTRMTRCHDENDGDSALRDENDSMMVVITTATTAKPWGDAKSMTQEVKKQMSQRKEIGKVGKTRKRTG